jgi:chromate reductase, NAD(P)H dehydrogenase (quinone)
MQILAISGSLRVSSSNTAVLHAVRQLAPKQVDIIIYDALGKLPHFNPDLDGETPPNEVFKLRSQVGQCDGILISSPEYAHGVPGSLKNALDWLVGSLEFPGKPVALINTSPRATYAQASLRETLTTMSARLIAEASITLSLLGRTIDPAGIASDPQLAGSLRAAIAAFVQAIEDWNSG